MTHSKPRLCTKIQEQNRITIFTKSYQKGAQTNEARTHIFLRQFSTCKDKYPIPIIDHGNFTRKFLEIFPRFEQKLTQSINQESKYFSHVVIKIWHVRYVKNYQKKHKKLLEFLWNF
jgi:hypothetical protein